MGGEEGGRGPKVTRGLRVAEVGRGRRDGGRGEAEREAVVRREEELEEEGGEMDRGADSWVESTKGEKEEGVRARGAMEGKSDGETARGETTESVALVLRDRLDQRAIPSTMKGESRLIQILGTERREWPTREL
jgi:hypothetical protein